VTTREFYYIKTLYMEIYMGSLYVIYNQTYIFKWTRYLYDNFLRKSCIKTCSAWHRKQCKYVIFSMWHISCHRNSPLNSVTFTVVNLAWANSGRQKAATAGVALFRDCSTTTCMSHRKITYSCCLYVTQYKSLYKIVYFM